MAIAATQNPEAGDVIAELLRRVSTLEQHNAEIKRTLDEAEKKHAGFATKDEQADFVTKKDLEILFSKIETAIANAKNDNLKTVFAMLVGFFVAISTTNTGAMYAILKLLLPTG